MTRQAGAIAAGLLAVVLVGALISTATPAQTMRRLVVPVGEVREVDVDYKVGFACDDTQLLRAWMVTRGGHNWFIVEGVEVGTTLCRVGTDPSFPSYLFEVVIEPTPTRFR